MNEQDPDWLIWVQGEVLRQNDSFLHYAWQHKQKEEATAFRRMLFHEELEALKGRVLQKKQQNAFLKDQIRRIR